MNIKMHDSRKLKENKKNRINYFSTDKNREKLLIVSKILLFILIFTILFFPTFSGNLIGNWIKDFFGTIINIIKTI